jgi:hypothetical protein
MILEKQPTRSIGLSNIWVQPALRVIADVAVEDATSLRRATLKVDGLLCGL